MDITKIKSFDALSDDEQKRALLLISKWKNIKSQEKCQIDFLEFIKYLWDGVILGRHHKILADKLNRVSQGKCKRLMVMLPPRHTKSEFASTYFPAWMMGLNPSLKIIQATHTAELAVRFGRRVRNIIDSEEYQTIFPDINLSGDNKSAGRWTTDDGGEAFYSGVGGAITGRGADLLIIDDPHSEQDAMSKIALEGAYEWYTSGPRQRMQPGGKIVLVMTRWSTKDLTGMLVKNQSEAKADQWHVVEFPAIMEHGPVWPEYWKQDELEKVKATLPVAKWNAQWMQNPTAEEGAILKREWWRTYTDENIPQLQHVIQSYDTAFLKKETADYSAITTWGIWYPSEDEGANLILLDAIKGRYEFPELRRLALEQYEYWKPETVIVEAKASGLPLTYELRKMDIPVVNFSPSKGNDKHARVNAVGPLFESGMIWAPEQKFAEEVIEECAAFPYGDHDDLVDSTTQAIMRFRQGGLIDHPEDYVDQKEPKPKRIYY